MDKVIFTTIEDNKDLVLSLSFAEGTEFGIDGFIIQRTPSLEHILQPYEKGASIDWTDDDKIILVKKVELSKDEIKIHSQAKNYEFDISDLDEEEIAAIVNILNKMNFDDSFKFDIK